MSINLTDFFKLKMWVAMMIYLIPDRKLQQVSLLSEPAFHGQHADKVPNKTSSRPVCGNLQGLRQTKAIFLQLPLGGRGPLGLFLA